MTDSLIYMLLLYCISFQTGFSLRLYIARLIHVPMVCLKIQFALCLLVVCNIDILKQIPNQIPQCCVTNSTIMQHGLLSGKEKKLKKLNDMILPGNSGYVSWFI